ncbi:MAG: Ribonuclease PH [Syntrophus sp. SKADARSKE-3]|nr:Ribonuclease PH [Syntrophus sp. SKADARSKE-3]
MRISGRRADELRDLKIIRDYLKYPEGSVLIDVGNTKVICTATILDEVPPFLRNTGRGWLTAEYAMLPMATEKRSPRESSRGKVGGRTHEIQRLIGRSLRAVTDLNAFGERTIHIDCDVIQADGGTRTASITGAFVALVELFRKLMVKGTISVLPVNDYVAAVSIGIVDGEALLDLDYSEDSRAEVDMNVVMTARGRFIEVQGTAEEKPFDRGQLNTMLELAEKGIVELTDRQRGLLGPL